MKKPSLLLLILGLIFWLGVSAANARATPEHWLPAEVPDGHFVPLDDESFQKLKSAFTVALTRSPLEADWSGSGLRIETPEPGVSAIREQVNQGQGFYLFRPKAARPLFLQAPHRFHDKLTGEITLHLFNRGIVRAASWNTRYRYEDESSDLAHTPNSPFTALGEAIATTQPKDARLIQIHGFNKNRLRNTGVAVTTDIIVSSGTKTPSPLARQITTCLRKAQLGEVGLYPTDIRALSGSNNVTGWAVREMGFQGFVHIENSLPVRRELAKNPAALDRYAACLVD